MLGEALPLPPLRSTDGGWWLSVVLGEPLLLALFAAGSALGAADAWLL